ncbi:MULTISPECIES: OadG family protein [Pseudoalteromonas]|uniref:Probable oxaloacetate decarboxylase gamma chain n=1 Tax=Pseudoalteromonas obscura TaxID=3048491 RepID=A0ABT7EN00_9GAMM|nr:MULTISPECIES: OadG family transporter subunit [Pseudoalteromonas]MBQ4840072.1 OadG family protein [Pseudoalteromonas luteoviolacea]MDK2596434.1 OadG family transporter subunit [Pseudoalteromonas sp. P94(2023)]
MEISELLAQAANLMLTGMVGVFLFLSILIFAVKALSKFAATGQELEQPNVKKPSAKPTSTGVPAAHIAAISAAVSQFRQNN